MDQGTINNPNKPLISYPSMIFWDGYGLSGGYSGIQTHGIELHKALLTLGIRPTVVGEAGLAIRFPQELVLNVTNQGTIRRLQKFKLAASYFVDQSIKKAVSGKKHIVHGLSNFNIPLGPPTSIQKRVLTVHDVIPFLDPSSVSATYAAQFKLILGRAVNVADQVICVSNWTLQSLLSFFPHIEHKCKVVHNGVRTYQINTEKMSYLRESGGEQGEILSIARFEKYKRLDLLIDIIERLPASYTLNLVTNEKGRQFCKKVGEKLISQQRLRIFVGVTDSQLTEMYRKSLVYVHPSIYEGFNIPAVEALLNGIPVVHCKGIGTEEIISSRVGIAMSPKASIDDWVSAVKEAKHRVDQEVFKNDLKAAIAKLPSWEQSARQVASIYEQLKP